MKTGNPKESAGKDRTTFSLRIKAFKKNLTRSKLTFLSLRGGIGWTRDFKGIGTDLKRISGWILEGIKNKCDVGFKGMKEMAIVWYQQMV